MYFPHLFVSPSQVDAIQKHVKDEPLARSIIFELSKEDLEVVLEGLEQIKKQLDAIG